MEKRKVVQIFGNHFQYRRWRLCLTHYLQGKGVEKHLDEQVVGDDQFMSERREVMAILLRTVG